MFIDLHMHEKTCSKDSFLSLAEMVELAKKRGLEGSLNTLRGVDAIEILNGSTMPDAAMMAVRYARKYGFGTTGGSDCHYPDKVGVYATYFPGNITSVEELVRAIVNHECRPAFHQDFSYFIWDLDNLLL